MAGFKPGEENSLELERARRLEKLYAQREALEDLIDDAIAFSGPTYDVDGQRVEKSAYLKTLNEQLDLIDKRINRLMRRRVTWLGTVNPVYETTDELDG